MLLLNDDRPTRFNDRVGTVSCIDLMLAPNEVARFEEWGFMDWYTIGSSFSNSVEIGKNLIY